MGGAGSIATRVADELGAAVRLQSPVRSISQGSGSVVVNADGVTLTARHVVMTIPPALIPDIVFNPPLSNDRLALYRAAVAGSETKTLLVYDEPFWRADGSSGQTAGPGTAAEVTIDSTPAAGRPGVIASFTFGPVAERLDTFDPRARRQEVLDAMAARLGPRAVTPIDYVETSWWNEEWTRGCSMAHFPIGVLTKFGSLLREPDGLVHWAGTETATTSHGAIDGAVRSGERAAREILA